MLKLGMSMENKVWSELHAKKNKPHYPGPGPDLYVVFQYKIQLNHAVNMDRRESTASQETFISLQQLDPSPIESPEDLDKQLPDLPSPSHLSRPSTLGLSGAGHSSVYYRKSSRPSC
jgi:hypothetical protein